MLALLKEVKAAKGDPRGGWWRAYADVVGSYFDHYMSLEEASNHLTTFQLTLLPGLFQTSAYRRSMIITGAPDMSAVDVERRIELAARRQARITADADFRIDVMLAESVLRHQVGGPAVMVEQLDHLARIGELPNVSVRVVPHGVGTYLGLIVQSFTMFEFPPLQRGLKEPPVIFVEGYKGALFQEDAEVLGLYRNAVKEIGGVALDAEASRKLLIDCAKECAA